MPQIAVSPRKVIYVRFGPFFIFLAMCRNVLSNAVCELQWCYTKYFISFFFRYYTIVIQYGFLFTLVISCQMKTNHPQIRGQMRYDIMMSQNCSFKYLYSNFLKLTLSIYHFVFWSVNYSGNIFFEINFIFHFPIQGETDMTFNKTFGPSQVL